jgi:NTP pyrophosphatase (non-canonical NTP hydrolase)
MDFNEYQKKSKKTDLGTRIESDLVYYVLGLTNESGEVAGKIKKLYRDKNGEMNLEFKEELAKELGDVLWYLSQIASKIDLNLEDVAKMNIDKLESRLKRGQIKGDGDQR